jgi:glycosyltransferase involved in cell wall biosynthesis
MKKQPIQVFAIFFHPGTSVTAVGGAEKRFVELLKNFLTLNNLKIAVLESAPSLLAKTEFAYKKWLLHSNFNGKGWLGTYFEWLLWIAKASFKSFILARHLKPKVVLIPNNTLPNLLSGYMAGLIFRRPICVVVHHIDVPFTVSRSREHSVYECYRNVSYSQSVSLIKTIAFYIALPLLRRMKAIIAVSNFTAKALTNSGVSGFKIVVSGNAIDLKSISAVKPYHNKKVFDGVFVGRIAKEKGVFDLLRVWQKVVKVKRGARLLIIGSGLELAAVKERIVRYGLENTVFIRGRCSETELYSLLKSSKLFIFPSVFEGWGIAVAEALACGLPVVAYDIPALREVFGKCKSVFLVPVKNIENMTSIVLDVLDSNEKEMKELSDSARVYARQFSWKKVAEKESRFLKTLLERV